MVRDPIEITRRLRSNYGEYLQSQFSFADNALYEQARELLRDGGQFVKGPFLEASMPFATEDTIDEMIMKGMLSADMRRAFGSQECARIRRYVHQVQAISKIQQGCNIVVATGTGSGKTECFLIPILDALMRERQAGSLGPGVRALLLYPMNALANDQMDRLRSLLRDVPYITFGRYIGETQEEDAKAKEAFHNSHPDTKPLMNELLSRKKMRDEPPNILVTNYAMLEYLLIRPQDNVLFEGAHGGHLRFLVLDEAHTYKGAQGAEVAILLRRLKDRSLLPKQRLTCIATSATLGGGQDDFPKVAQFAKALFDEPFEPQDIITAQRQELQQPIGPKRDLKFYGDLSKWFQHGESGDSLLAYAQISEKSGSSPNVALYRILGEDPLMYQLRRALCGGVRSFSELAKELVDIAQNDNESARLLALLVDLGAKAKPAEDAAPLLSAKYHIFARALEGAFAAYYPEKRLFLDRHTTFDGHPVYEIANCIRCGQEYLIGEMCVDLNGQQQLGPTETAEGYYMPDSGEMPGAPINEDDLDDDASSDADEQLFDLCTACGAINPSGALGNGSCCDAPMTKLLRVKSTGQAGKRKCLRCGHNQANSLRRLMGNDDASTEVLARTLYHALPAEDKSTAPAQAVLVRPRLFAQQDDSEMAEGDHIESGHKLLMFSDSRQEAAFAAVYMQRRYDDWLWRHVILSTLEDHRQNAPFQYKDLLNLVIQRAQRQCLFSDNETFMGKKAIAGTHLMKELIEMEPRIGLHGLGLIDIYPEFPRLDAHRLHDIADKLGVPLQEASALYPVLLDTLRRQGVMEFPSEVSPQDDAFVPRNRIMQFRCCGSENKAGRQILGWLPARAGASNRRLDYVCRILERTKAASDADGMAKELLHSLMNVTDGIPQALANANVLRIDGHQGAYTTPLSLWRIQANERDLYRCDKCGAITPYNIQRVCPEYRCNGTLERYQDSRKSRYGYFIRQYRDMKPVPMRAEEHTAQLTSDRATELQNQFKANQVNVLSCSTTFEMGVDIGSLEGVMLRNVPPETANYVQRAGRAGRRISAAAFVLTYARRRSHDLTFYLEPAKMIQGIIRAPYIDLNNPNIVRRHIHSTVMAWFFRNYREYFKTAVTLLGDGAQIEPVDVALRRELATKPIELLQSLQRIVPPHLHADLGLDAWGWMRGFVEEKTGNKSLPVLVKALQEYEELIETLNKLVEQYKSENKFSQAGYALNMQKHFEQTDTIGFLSRGGVIPRYGFPVDSVSLEILHHEKEATQINLDRDLSQAIVDYAPGAKVIAAGRLWQPYALKVLRGRAWPTYRYAVCEHCGRLHCNTTVLGEQVTAEAETECCASVLKHHTFIEPVYGFTTKRDEEPKRAVDTRPDRFFATQVYFDGFEEGDTEEKTLDTDAGTLLSRYAQRGRLTILNKGMYNQGFYVCEKCGFSQQGDRPRARGAHETPTGHPCMGRLHKVHLGHQYLTTTLRLCLPGRADSEEAWLSVLYAILEGSCNVLDIDRREINGCLWWPMGRQLSPELILFDTVPGGAGHVKKIQDNILDVLRAAAARVDGRCKCGEETSCYGCLRNYINQRDHEKLRRGAAKAYFQDVL